MYTNLPSTSATQINPERYIEKFTFDQFLLIKYFLKQVLEIEMRGI